MSEYRNPDPLTGEPRPEPVGTCAVCHTLVLPGHQPVEVEPIVGHRFLPSRMHDRCKRCNGTHEAGVIHGSFDCMDRAQCPETRRGEVYGLEWSTRCLLFDGHPDDDYWDEL
jgi:hypothetical protein